MAEPLYSIGTWDVDRETYSPQKGLTVPPFNITRSQLRQAIRELKAMGYRCHRKRDPTASPGETYWDNDVYVLIERTDGKHWKEIRREWRRYLPNPGMVGRYLDECKLGG